MTLVLAKVLLVVLCHVFGVVAGGHVVEPKISHPYETTVLWILSIASGLTAAFLGGC